MKEMKKEKMKKCCRCCNARLQLDLFLGYFGTGCLE
jgi:hypothetical protein